MNNRTKTLLLSLTLFVLLGCQSKAEKEADNRQSFENPQNVGTLPNGQVVSRVSLKHTPDGETHFIYFTGNTATVNSVRKEVAPQLPGRTKTVNTTFVHINGIDFDVEKLREIVRKADEDRNAAELDAIQEEVQP